MQTITREILISSKQVTRHNLGDTYEFILNDQIEVIDCIKIENQLRGKTKSIRQAQEALDGLLFELNHVRVNPKADNSYIIQCLTQALQDIGVTVHSKPHAKSMEVCYKPMGEISDNVRFYISPKGKLVFLTPAFKPRLISH